MVSHVVLALVGLLAVAALVVTTMTRQRQGRLERRVDHVEDEVGRHPDDAEDPVRKRRAHEQTLRGRVRRLEVAVIVAEGLIKRLQRRPR